MSNVDEKFIVNLQGKDFIKYEGLLDLAHQKGLKIIETELIQIPNKENDNTCIVQAIAKINESNKFYGIGDASPTSVNRMITPHIIRMAETRAKARALRDLTNIGMTAIEELGEEPVDDPEPKKPNTPAATKPLSEKQVGRLIAIAKSVNIDETKAREQVKTKFNKTLEELTNEEYKTVCNGYEGLKR